VATNRYAKLKYFQKYCKRQESMGKTFGVDRSIAYKKAYLIKYYEKFPLDMIYNKMLYIKTRATMIPLDPRLRSAQMEMLEIVQDYMYRDEPLLWLIPKARRQGVSTIIEAIIYCLTSQKPNLNATIIADEIKNSTNIFEMTKLYHNKLPDLVKHPLKKSNAKELAFDGMDSLINIDTANKVNIGRSWEYIFIHLSEISFFGNTASSIMLGIMQTVPEDMFAMVVLESTGNGIGEYFYDKVMASLAGQNDFQVFFIAWFKHPDYVKDVPENIEFEYYEDHSIFGKEVAVSKMLIALGLPDIRERMYWRRWAIKNKCDNDLKKFKQEYPACFTGEIRASFPDKQNGIEIFEEHPEYLKGEQQVFRLKTSLGYTVRATANHKFMTVNNGWVKLEDLTINDSIKLLPPYFSKDYQYVEIQYDLPILNHKIKIDEDLAEFIGIFMGNGSFGKNKNSNSYWLSIVFNKEDDSFDKYYNYCIKIFGRVNKRVVGINGGGLELRLSSKWIDSFFISLDLTTRKTIFEKNKGGIKRKVHVPTYIMQSPKSVIASFIRGLFDADGYIGYKYPRVRFFTKYKQFISDIQFLLLGFGITSRSVSIVKTNGEGRSYLGNELQLRTLETKVYMKEIGFVSSRKNNRWLDRRTEGQFGKNAKPLVFETKVVSIEADGIENIYDKAVYPNHYYSANGLYVHNSVEEAFQASGVNKFDVDKVHDLMTHCKLPVFKGTFDKDGNLVSNENGKVEIWEFPKMYWKRRYSIAIDTGGTWFESETRCADYTVVTVFDRITLEDVSRIKVHMKPKFLVDLVCKLGHYYNNAQIAPEINKWASEIDDTGLTIIDYLRDSYSNLYMRETVDTETKELTLKVGFHTNKQTRPLLIDHMETILDEFNETGERINDITVLTEMLSFVVNEKAGKYEHAAGKKDDCLFSQAIARFVAKDMGKPYYDDGQDDIEDEMVMSNDAVNAFN